MTDVNTEFVVALRELQADVLDNYRQRIEIHKDKAESEFRAYLEDLMQDYKETVPQEFMDDWTEIYFDALLSTLGRTTI